MRITPAGGIRAWRTGVAGAGAVATDGRRVLLFGGHPPDPCRCVLGRLGESALEDPQERPLVFPDGRALTGGGAVGGAVGDAVGRGPLLHVFAGTGWYQLDVGSLP